jgi:hypothetical protein
MPTLKEVRAQIGTSRLLLRKEIKELPNILWDNERVDKLVQGYYSGGRGILVATDKRLIFVDKRLFDLKVEDFPYDKISSIQYETGLLLGKITIFTSGNEAVIEKIMKPRAREFCEYVRASITNTPKRAAAPQAQANSGMEVVSQLERLAKLKEQGILTEQEFAEQKRKILNAS